MLHIKHSELDEDMHDEMMMMINATSSLDWAIRVADGEVRISRSCDVLNLNISPQKGDWCEGGGGGRHVRALGKYLD